MTYYLSQHFHRLSSESVCYNCACAEAVAFAFSIVGLFCAARINYSCVERSLRNFSSHAVLGSGVVWSDDYFSWLFRAEEFFQTTVFFFFAFGPKIFRTEDVSFSSVFSWRQLCYSACLLFYFLLFFPTPSRPPLLSPWGVF